MYKAVKKETKLFQSYGIHLLHDFIRLISFKASCSVTLLPAFLPVLCDSQVVQQICCTLWKSCPFSWLSTGKWKTFVASGSGEFHGLVGIQPLMFFANTFWLRSAKCLNKLLWYSIQVWFVHNPGLFSLTASLKCHIIPK